MLFEDQYKTITKPVEAIYREKGSKFLAFAIPASSEEDVKRELQALKKKYYNASHHCYAYILGFDKSAYRLNDDGEPSGTAGRPIYGQLLSFNVTNTLLVVVRYFGGTKLGVGGLVNAYKTAAKMALESADIEERTLTDVYEIKYAYEQMNEVMSLIKEEKLEQLETDFGLDCRIVLAIKHNKVNQVADKLSKISGLQARFIRLE